MFLTQCPFCENVNPPNSKFCNACGVRMHAALCPHCGAVNVVTATTCVSCAAPLIETLHTALCPRCGAANEPTATVCDKCAADLGSIPAPAPISAKQPAAPGKSAPGKSVPVKPAPIAPAEPALTAADDDHFAPTLLDESEASLGYSVHFGRNHTVTLDPRYDVDASHLHVPPMSVVANAALPVHQSSGNDHFTHSFPFVPLTEPLAIIDARRHRRYAVVFGVAMLAALAGSTYYVYGEHSMARMSSLLASVREPERPEASSDARPITESDHGTQGAASRGSTTTGAVAAAPVAAIALVPAPAPVAANPQPSHPLTSVPLAERSVGAVDPSSAAGPAPMRQRTNGRAQLGSAEAAAAGAAAPQKTSEARSERQPQGFGPCTDAIAALGLCTPQSTIRQSQ